MNCTQINQENDKLKKRIRELEFSLASLRDMVRDLRSVVDGIEQDEDSKEFDQLIETVEVREVIDGVFISGDVDKETAKIVVT